VLIAGALFMGCASTRDMRLRDLREGLVERWKTSTSPESRFFLVRAARLRSELNARELPAALATASDERRAFIDTYYDLLAEWIVQLSVEMDRAWNDGRYATAATYAEMYLLFEGSHRSRAIVIEDHLLPPAKGTRADIARHIIARYERMFPVFRWADDAPVLPPDIAGAIKARWRPRSGYRRNFVYRDRDATTAGSVLSGAPVITVSAGAYLKDKLVSEALPPSASEVARYEREMEAISARVTPQIEWARTRLNSLRSCTTTPVVEIVRENYAHRDRYGTMRRVILPGDATHIEKTTTRFGGDTVCTYADPARARSLELEIRALESERPAGYEIQRVLVVDPRRSTGTFAVTVKMGEASWHESFSSVVYGASEEREKKFAREVVKSFKKAIKKLADQIEPPWLPELAPGVSPEDREREIRLFRRSFDLDETGEELTYSGRDIQTLVELGRLLPE